MLGVLLCVVRRDLLLALRRRADLFGTLAFFVLVCALFPLGVGAAPAMLRAAGPGIVWVAALLACTLSLNRMFAPDHADGTLEQMLLSAEPLVLIVIGKVFAHWLVSSLPLVLLAPLLALQFDLPREALAPLLGSLLLGTPVLGLVGAVGAALTLGLRGGGVLTALLVLPLSAPVLIFGASAAAADAGTWQPQLMLLGGLLAASLALAPLAVVAALRIALD